MRRLAGKVAIVTGGGSGIGRAVAHTLARDGAAVVVADVKRESAAAVVSEICDAGGRALAVVVDVSDEDAVRAMLEAAVDAYGGLDILHNNASDLALLRDDLDVVATDRGPSGRIVTQWPNTMEEYRRRTLVPDADAYETTA